MLGIDLEIESDLYKVFIQVHLNKKNDKALDETKKALFKLYYPDIKDASESLAEELQRRVVEDPNKVMKIGADTSKKIDPLTANHLLNKS